MSIQMGQPGFCTLYNLRVAIESQAYYQLALAKPPSIEEWISDVSGVAGCGCCSDGPEKLLGMIKAAIDAVGPRDTERGE